MTRICLLCKRPPREGELMTFVRLREEEDVVSDAVKKGVLYQACGECTESHRARLAARTGREVGQVTNRDMT